MNVDRLQGRIIKLQVAGMIVRSVLYVILAWISIEAIIYIGDHGIKSLVDLLWNGPGG